MFCEDRDEGDLGLGGKNEFQVEPMVVNMCVRASKDFHTIFWK